MSFNLVDSAVGSVVALSDIDSISITGFINSNGGTWSASATGNATFNVAYNTKGWFESVKAIGIAGTISNPNLLSTYSSSSFSLSAGQSSTGVIPTAFSGVQGGLLSQTGKTDFLGSGTFVINFVMSQGNDGTTTSPVRNGVVTFNSRPTLSGEVVVTYGIIPEPSSASLLLGGLAGLAAMRRRRQAD